ncbi:MAG: hypothetical protein HYZ28_06405 [Myxococcales bacterium]|nr:hypothetical protein [Myxococcales bacterium]
MSSAPLTLMAALSALPASAERGLMAFSLEAGVGVDELERGGRLLGASEYGVSERWAVASSAGLEWRGGRRLLSLGLGPRWTMVQGDWTNVHLFLSPELLVGLTPGTPLDLAGRGGVGVRYQLLWGMGVSFQGSIRVRSGQLGAEAPAAEALLLAGIFIEA